LAATDHVIAMMADVTLSGSCGSGTKFNEVESNHEVLIETNIMQKI